MATGGPLNRRKDDRYIIDEIPLEGIGTMVEISKNGLKIKRAPGVNLEDPTVTFALFDREMKANVRWQDRSILGLQSAIPFDDPEFFIPSIKRAKEIIAPPQMKVHLDSAVGQFQKDESLVSMINLLMEVDSPEPDIRKVGQYIDQISSLQEQEKQSETKKEGEGGQGGEDDDKGDQEKTIKEELIARAIELQGREEAGEIEIGFAITMLGLSKVCEIIQDHINKRFFKSETSLPLFENYETFNILKSVVFKNLCRFFGLLDMQPEGSTLLSLETTGVDLLIKESSGILDTYYKTPSRLYSEFSRMYERTFFGVDPLQINLYYFEKDLNTFGDLFNGYVLAHHTLNPQYFSSEDLKISLNKEGLIFSYLTYLTYLAVQFLLDKDRESGFTLAKRLKGRGMDERKIDQFLENSIGDTKTILRNLKLSGTLSQPLLPDGGISIESYLGKDIRFDYLIQSFRDFSRRQVKRMALRYERRGVCPFYTRQNDELGKL